MTMLQPRLVARTVVDGCATVIDDFESGIIADETNMTDRLAGAISTALNGKVIGGVVWKARTLRTGPGVAAEEKRHGADLLGVLEIDTRRRKTKKGFLAQAKIAEPGKRMSPSEWKRFQGQCKTMLDRTDEAFAVIYSRKRGVIFLPAETILEIDRDQLFEAGSRTLHGFFEDHVKCEIGDRKLYAPTIDVLDRLKDAPGAALSDFATSTILSLKVTDAPNP